MRLGRLSLLLSWNAVERYLAEIRQIGHCRLRYCRWRWQLHADIWSSDSLLLAQVSNESTNVFQQLLVLHKQLMRSRLKQCVKRLILKRGIFYVYFEITPNTRGTGFFFKLASNCHTWASTRPAVSAVNWSCRRRAWATAALVCWLCCSRRSRRSWISCFRAVSSLPASTPLSDVTVPWQMINNVF